MTSTRFDLFVFDFDGTLVVSAGLKRQAFYDIFPTRFEPAVTRVLTSNPDGSRHVVIPAMLAEARILGISPVNSPVDALIEDYGVRVSETVACAPKMKNADEVLLWASRVGTCYIASMTPHDELLRHIKTLGWGRFVTEAYGYPRAKTDVVAELLQRHNMQPGRLLVVGDGVSDREAAMANGTAFHQIIDENSLEKILS